MLFAYALSGDTTLTGEAIHELRQVADDLAAENLPAGETLGFVWDALTPGTQAEGVFLRGYQQVRNRTQALWLINTLRRLSQRFPQYRVVLSGWGDLPMTEVVAGEFELFATAYDRALAALAADNTQGFRGRVSS
ncbi:hypothetical protein D3C72_543500 [compost metagenome]